MGIKIWAHRGASGYEIENTLEAFALAVKQGADGVELDVQLSKDGELVVFHDEELERISDGHGLVKEHTLAQLKKIKLYKPGYIIHSDKKNWACCNEVKELGKIPTLREVYELLKPYPIRINVELKTGLFPYEGIEEKVIALGKEMEMTERILYSSFNHYTLLRLKQIDPSVRTGMLIGDVLVGAGNYAKSLGVEAIHPLAYELFMPEVLRDFKESGLALHPWTLNDEEQIKEAIGIKVDAIITNYPDKAIAIREMENVK